MEVGDLTTSAVAIFLLLISTRHTAAANDILCTIDPVTNFVDMCKNGCNKYIIAENYTRYLSLKDGSGAAHRCNMTVEAEPGLGLIVREGLVFDLNSCRAGVPCGEGDYLHLSGGDDDKCICKKIEGVQMYSTRNNVLQIDYSGDFAFAIGVKTIGCPIRTLSSNASKKSKLSVTPREGDPTTDSSYVVRVMCPEGYMIKQNFTFVENECIITQNGEELLGRWREEGVGCSKIKCSRPPEIENGDFSPYKIGEPYKRDESITYRCDPGYEMSKGYRVRKCVGVHGKGPVFDGFPPTCTKKSCGEPPAIQGQATLEGSGIVFESTRTVKCSRGFSINGPSILTCLSNGTWSTAPTCDIARCLEQPRVDNSQYEVKHSPYSERKGEPQVYGSEWRFTCYDGFKMIGSSTMTCREDGSWSPAPICTAEKCDLTNLPVSTEHICTDCVDNTMDRVNSTRTYTCKDGFTAMEVKVQCERSGNWSTLPPCSRVDCSAPAPVDNGRWVYTSSMYGDSADLVCDTGYEPENNSKLTCSMSGAWVNGSSCKVINCEAPANHPNASIVNTKYSTDYQSIIRYECNTGYHLQISSSRQIQCRADGSWSPLPICEIVDCGPPLSTTVANATLTEMAGTVYGSEVRYACAKGYRFTGAKSMKCQADGSWSSLPFCEVVNCKAPDNFTAASVISYTGMREGDVAQYKCHSKSTVTYENSTCGEEGVWSTPACVTQPPPSGYMLYVYIGIGAFVVLLVILILIVGLCYRRKAKKRRGRARVSLLADKSAKRGEGSHCSNDSGLFVDGEPGEFDNAPSVGSYDIRTGSLSMKPTWSVKRYGDPPTQSPYSTDSLTKPRSRQPIGASIPLVDVEGVDGEPRNPLYGEQKTERRGSKNSSPCTVAYSPCSTARGMPTPPLNDFNHLCADESNSSYGRTLSPKPSRHANIVDHSASGTMVKYSTNPPGLKVLSGKELKPTNVTNGLESPTKESTTPFTSSKYNDKPVYY